MTEEPVDEASELLNTNKRYLMLFVQANQIEFARRAFKSTFQAAMRRAVLNCTRCKYDEVVQGLTAIAYSLFGEGDQTTLLINECYTSFVRPKRTRLF